MRRSREASFQRKKVRAESANLFLWKRRRRDLNPRAAINDLHPFQGCPFGQLGYFSVLPLQNNLCSAKQKLF